MRIEEADRQPPLHHREPYLHHRRPPASPPPPIRRPHQRRKSLEPSTDAITYYQGKHVAIPRHHNLERNTSWFSPLLLLRWIRCSYFCCILVLFFCCLVLWIICSMLLDCLCWKPREAYGFFVLVLPLWFCYVKLMDYMVSLDAALIWMFLLWIAEVLTRDMLEDL